MYRTRHDMATKYCYIEPLGYHWFSCILLRDLSEINRGWGHGKRGGSQFFLSLQREGNENNDRTERARFTRY